jgi:hypothetical protein
MRFALALLGCFALVHPSLAHADGIKVPSTANEESKLKDAVNKEVKKDEDKAKVDAKNKTKAKVNDEAKKTEDDAKKQIDGALKGIKL